MCEQRARGDRRKRARFCQNSTDRGHGAHGFRQVLTRPVTPLHEALAVARSAPYPYLEGRVLTQLGIVDQKRDETAAAQEHLQAAMSIFTRLKGREGYEAGGTAAGGAVVTTG